MLKSMRHNARYFYVLFGIVILSFVFWGVAPDKNTTTKQVLATIGGEDVMLDEFWRNYDQAERLYKDIYKEEFTEAKQERLKQDILSNLVGNKVLSVAARDMGLTITDAELESAILSDPSFQRDGVFDSQMYENTLRLNRLPIPYYEDRKRNELLMEKVAFLIQDPIELTGTEIDNLPEEEEFRRTLQTALLDSKKEAALVSFINGLRKRMNIVVREDYIL